MDCSLPVSLSMGFSRQGYWTGLPFPSPGDLPNPGTEPRSPPLRADALPSEPLGKPHFEGKDWLSNIIPIMQLSNLKSNFNIIITRYSFHKKALVHLPSCFTRGTGWQRHCLVPDARILGGSNGPREESGGKDHLLSNYIYTYSIVSIPCLLFPSRSFPHTTW